VSIPANFIKGKRGSLPPSFRKAAAKRATMTSTKKPNAANKQDPKAGAAATSNLGSGSSKAAPSNPGMHAKKKPNAANKQDPSGYPNV